MTVKSAATILTARMIPTCRSKRAGLKIGQAVRVLKTTVCLPPFDLLYEVRAVLCMNQQANIPLRPTIGLLVKSSFRLQNDKADPIPEYLNAIKGSFFISKASCPSLIWTIKIMVVVCASVFYALTSCSLAPLCLRIKRADFFNAPAASQEN